MIVTLCGTGYRYDVQSVCQLFFPREKFSEENGKRLTVTLLQDRACAELVLDGKRYACEEKLAGIYDNVRTSVKKCAYNVLSAATGRKSPWGIVTGIRPAMLYEKLEDAFAVFTELYGVSAKKAELCADVLKNRATALPYNTENSCSLYVSIPYCPSRCRYCSFVSEATARELKQLPAYVQVLCRELDEKAQKIKNDKKTLVTAYIGGGTPTVLEPEELERLLSVMSRLFSGIREFTVEAGRPDTITERKLALMHKYGVTRISVNPQTLNDEVLSNIGRRHTAADFYRAYELASQFPFDKNVDLIAGLPGDTVAGFCRTLDAVAALRPANITVHTLYLKRAADFGAHENVHAVKQAAEASGVPEMLAYAQEKLYENGYGPYYLYRQKNTVDNLENIGYALAGKECLYNIYMMDDIPVSYTHLDVYKRQAKPAPNSLKKRLKQSKSTRRLRTVLVFRI